MTAGQHADVICQIHVNTSISTADVFRRLANRSRFAELLSLIGQLFYGRAAHCQIDNLDPIPDRMTAHVQ